MKNMKNMKKLSASILSADFGRLAEQVHLAEQAGVDWIHIDVMDGHFVPNITIGPAVTQALKEATALPLDVHLMISNPERYVEDFVKAGADWLGIHVEATVHLERLIQQIKEAGAKATVTLNPATPLNCLEYVLKEVDMVLLMTVNPGFSGQKFIPEVLPKIRRLRQMIDAQNLPTLIQVDGGVHVDTVIGDAKRRQGSARDEHLFANFNDFDQFCRVGIKVHHITRLLGCLRTRIHGHAHIGLSQCRCVICAVACHGNQMSFRLFLSNQCQFIFGSRFGDEIVHTSFLGNSGGCKTVVTGYHYGLDPHRPESFKPVLKSSFHDVFQVDNTQNLGPGSNDKRCSTGTGNTVDGVLNLYRKGPTDKRLDDVGSPLSYLPAV